MKYCSLLVCLVIIATAAVAAEEPAERRPVLVLIDIQDFYFEGGSLPLNGAVAASRNAARVLERFRALEWPVIHVQHLPRDRDRPGQDVEPASYRIHPAVAPRAGETVIGKHHANAFRDTTLLDELRRLDPGRLVVLGMQTQMCVEAATRAAADLGFEVTVVGDACATRNLEHDGVAVPSEHVHHATLAALEGTYATVVSGDELLSELPEPE
jgi:nicotinamidase-related amidase